MFGFLMVPWQVFSKDLAGGGLGGSGARASGLGD